MHFSLLQSAFLLTAECIFPYCIWSLKDPAHLIPNQIEIATEEFCPKSLLRKQNKIDSIESHFQILHHLKIVHIDYCNALFYKLPESDVESKTQGSRPWPRTQKNFKAKDRLSRGQGQGPRTQTQVFSKKKRSSKIFFGRSLLEETKKKVFADFPQGFWRFPTKFPRFKNNAVLEPRTGQFSWN